MPATLIKQVREEVHASSDIGVLGPEDFFSQSKRFPVKRLCLLKLAVVPQTVRTLSEPLGKVLGRGLRARLHAASPSRNLWFHFVAVS